MYKLRTLLRVECVVCELHNIARTTHYNSTPLTHYTLARVKKPHNVGVASVCAWINIHAFGSYVANNQGKISEFIIENRSVGLAVKGSDG